MVVKTHFHDDGVVHRYLHRVRGGQYQLRPCSVASMVVANNDPCSADRLFPGEIRSAKKAGKNNWGFNVKVVG